MNDKIDRETKLENFITLVTQDLKRRLLILCGVELPESFCCFYRDSYNRCSYNYLFSCQQPPPEIHRRHFWPRPSSNNRWVTKLSWVHGRGKWSWGSVYQKVVAASRSSWADSNSATNIIIGKFKGLADLSKLAALLTFLLTGSWTKSQKVITQVFISFFSHWPIYKERSQHHQCVSKRDIMLSNVSLFLCLHNMCDWQ